MSSTIILVAAILTTLAEETEPGQSVGATTIYLALQAKGYGMDVYERLIGGLVTNGLLETPSAHRLAITRHGRDIAKELAEIG